MSFFTKLFGATEGDRNYEPNITVEKIQHIFEYGKLKDLIGTGSDELSNLQLGGRINWESESKFRKAYKNIPEQIVPPYIQWSNNPYFAYVAIVDNAVQYYYGEHGESAVYICPRTTNVNHLKLIDGIFEHYYEKFDLPASLNKSATINKKADNTDKMRFLSTYLTTHDNDFFKTYFSDNDDIYGTAMWIDWREEDEDIITYCENILKTGRLDVDTFEASNERGFETVITYNGQKTVIPYHGAGADRDTTLKTLNNVIQPDHEIRLCKESVGQDTLCFIPLSKSQWHYLETKFSKQVEAKFERITNGTKMFS
jgi:hypothetical protein